MTLKFMGQEFKDREALAKAFPAFRGDDAIRAIKAGATTPMEVELYNWNWRNGAAARARASKRLNGTKALVDSLDGKSARRAKPKPKKARKGRKAA